MSGRAYARNPSGALGGATDIESFVPHRFRIDAPRATNKAKELAIRRAIQRRCKEKNWKKLLRLRHTRLVPLVSPTDEQPSAVENGAEKVEKPEENTVEATPVENGKNHEENDQNDTIVAVNGAQENGAVAVGTKEENEALVEQQAALEKTKQQLQDMEAELATLSAEKHEKFQQLKDILIAEARSKMVPPMPKKRRVDSLGSVGTGSSPRLAGTSFSAGSSEEGAGLSLLGAPNPSLLRAQSFSGTTLGLSTCDTAAAVSGKDTKRL